MKVKTFVETAGNFDERELLFKFHNGVKHTLNHLDATLDIGHSYSPCDVAVIMGSWKPRDRNHHVVRNSVINEAKCFLVIETPLLGRKMVESHLHYRIGVNGFLNNAGQFILQNCPDDRLAKLEIQWPGWQNDNRDNIVLLLQLPGDASLRGINIYEWATHAVKKIRKFSNRPIRVRTHPSHTPKEGDEFHQFVYNVAMVPDSNVTFSLGKEMPLEEELSKAFCTVSFSSGSSIDSVLAGVPTIACDPGNFAFDVSSNYLDRVEDPLKANTQQVVQWLSNLAYSQWTAEEMENGIAWQHLRPIIDRIPQVPQGKKSK